MKTPTVGRQDLRESEFKLFAELKRRNVFRVGAAYLATAWLIVHVGTVLRETIETPEWVMRFVILLLALGFPGALAFAWAFEVTPQGLKRTREVPLEKSITRSTGRKLDFIIIGVLAAVLAFVVLDAYVLTDRTRPGPASIQGKDVSIAVLPFADLSPAKDNEYFSDGMSEELLNRLAKVDRFRVTGRTSSFAFKGKNDDLRTIGEKLGVESILEGSVRKQDDRVRITAQLISVHDGSHVWSDTFDRHLKDVFEIQDDIAREVVAALTRTLLAEGNAATNADASASRRPTSNLEAYNSYLRGQYLLRGRIGKEMEQALVEFQRAVTLDPKFALAHVGVANSLALLANYEYRNIADIAPQAQAAIARALELDPDLAEAYAAKNLLLTLQGATIGERLPLIERAVALNPNDALALQWLGDELANAGRPVTESIRVYERAYAIDPLAPIIVSNLAFDLYRGGDKERARVLVDELATLTPGRDNALLLRADFAALDGRTDDFVRWLSRAIKTAPDNPDTYIQLGFGYAALGDTTAAARQYERARSLSPTKMWATAWLAWLRVYSGDSQAALVLLRDGLQHYPNDAHLRLAQAIYDYTTGTKQALTSLRAAAPLLFADPPELEVQYDSSYWHAPQAVFLSLRAGDTGRASTIADAFYDFTDRWAGPAPKGWLDLTRARMAAALGDRAGVMKHLEEVYKSGSALWAWVPNEPLFRPYAADPEIAALLAKHAERRAEWRRQLAAEGL